MTRHKNAVPAPEFECLANKKGSTPKDWVALTLTVGLATALNVLVVGIFLALMMGKADHDGSIIGENATQIITGSFAGITSVVGAYLGFQAGSKERTNGHATTETTTTSTRTDREGNTDSTETRTGNPNPPGR